MGKPEQIQSVIRSIFEEYEKQHKVSKELTETWAKAAGDEAVRHTLNLLYQKEILTAVVDSSVWVQELNQQRPALLKQLQKIPGIPVRDLRIKLG